MWDEREGGESRGRWDWRAGCGGGGRWNGRGRGTGWRESMGREGDGKGWTRGREDVRGEGGMGGSCCFSPSSPPSHPSLLSRATHPSLPPHPSLTRPTHPLSPHPLPPSRPTLSFPLVSHRSPSTSPFLSLPSRPPVPSYAATGLAMGGIFPFPSCPIIPLPCSNPSSRPPTPSLLPLPRVPLPLTPVPSSPPSL